MVHLRPLFALPLALVLLVASGRPAVADPKPPPKRSETVYVALTGLC